MADTTFNPDEYLSAKGPAPASTPPDPLALQNFDPDAYLEQKAADEAQALQSQYGGVAGTGIAGAEALARGASLGASDVALTELGISTPEAIQKYKEANPLASFAGEVVGSGVPIALTEGAAAPLALGKIGTGALVGGVLGAGTVISDAALGDPNLNAQKILADIGTGVLAGAGFGALEKGIAALPALLRGTAKEAPKLEEAIAAVPKTGVQPTTLEQIQKSNEQAIKYGGETLASEAGPALDDALSRVALKNTIDPWQRAMLDDPELMAEGKAIRQSPSEMGQAIRARETMQRKELLELTDNAIESIAPGRAASATEVEAGERAGKILTDQIEKNRRELGPVFKTLNKIELDPNEDTLDGMMRAMIKRVPNVSKIFDAEAATPYVLKPYTTAMGLDRSTYNTIKEALEGLADNPNDFNTLRNIRKGMGQNIDFAKGGDAAREIMQLKAGAMDYLQEQLEKPGYSLNVRNAFRDYAINEKNADIIEGLGIKAGKPLEKVLDKIFANTETVKAARDIAGQEGFDQILSDYMSLSREAATDPATKAFSSAKWSTFLNKTKPDVLNEAFSAAPERLQRLRDVNLITRVVPDAAPGNPSGTAPTLMRLFKENGIDPLKWKSDAIKLVKDWLEERQKARQVNSYLSGETTKISQLKMIHSIAMRTGEKISGGAKAVWGSPLPKALAIEGAERLSDNSYQSHVDRLKQLTGNPEAMAKHLGDSTFNLSQAAPNVAQGIQSTMARGIQFLASKIPQVQGQFLLSQPEKPSQEQKQKFGRYLNAVDKPLSAIAQVKNVTLTPETMEALQTVHPDLLNEMRKEVMSHFSADKAEKLTYAQKAAISQFLGQPLSSNMTIQTTLSNQMVYAQPNASAQSAPKPTRATIGGMKKLNSAGRASTQIQEGKSEQ